jgi:hypothetical protein
MSTAKTDVTLRSALTSLLAERRLLRELVQKAIIYRLRYDTERTAETEQSISDLVTSPLNLERGEKPAERHLAQACEHLPFVLTAKEHPELVERPELIFEGLISVIPGVSISGLASALQARLIALTAPLDTTLSKMLAEA